MEKWKKRSVDLITSLSLGGGSVSVIPYYPQKTAVSGEESRYFKRSTPEAHGISSKRIYNMLVALESEKRANIHNLMVLAGGEVIAECSSDGYNVNTWHLSHSMSKTATGMVIGALVNRGMLSVSTRLVELFPEIPYRDKRFADITVSHLLAMMSGVEFFEAGVVTEVEWTRAFFDSALRFTPGTSFAYNSMNSYMLAVVAERVAKTSFSDLAREYIFEPLGITNWFWELGPEGVAKGGWGLFLSPESWLKIGYMLSRGGVFENKRILSGSWVEESTSIHASAPTSLGDYDYGYQMWVGRHNDELLFNGMLGQNIWICPHNDIVVMINSGNNELFQMSPALDIIRKYLAAEIADELHPRDLRMLHEKEVSFFDVRRTVRPLEKKRGLLYWLNIRSKTPFDERFDALLGRYDFNNNNVGMLPFFLLGMQNNLNTGIGYIEFSRNFDSLIMSWEEAGDLYSLEIGLYAYRESVLSVRGEKYLVTTLGEARLNVDGEEEYRIALILPEMPNTRYIRIRRTDSSRLTFELSENPNDRLVGLVIAKARRKGAVKLALDLLERGYGANFIEKKIGAIFNPVLIGVDTRSPLHSELLSEMRESVVEESATVRFLRAVVSRFFREAYSDAEAEISEFADSGKSSGGERRFTFSSVFSRLLGSKSTDGSGEKK